MYLFISFFFARLILSDISQQQQAIIQADKNLNKLIVEHDTTNASQVYAPQFVLTTSSGKVKLKQDMLNEIGLTELLFEINETENVQVRVINDTAVLTGKLHQKGTYKNKSFDNFLLVTDTWVFVAGNWKLMAGHATLIKP